MYEPKKILSSIRLTPSDHAFLVTHGGLSKEISSYVQWLKIVVHSETPPPCIYVHNIRLKYSRGAGFSCPLVQLERMDSDDVELWNRDPAALESTEQKEDVMIVQLDRPPSPDII